MQVSAQLMLVNRLYPVSTNERPTVPAAANWTRAIPAQTMARRDWLREAMGERTGEPEAMCSGKPPRLSKPLYTVKTLLHTIYSTFGRWATST